MNDLIFFFSIAEWGDYSSQTWGAVWKLGGNWVGYFSSVGLDKPVASLLYLTMGVLF